MRLMRMASRTLRVRSLRGRLRRQDGASLVEFALSLGIFLAVSVGILILCMALFTYEYVDFASREAARWASVRGGNCSSTTVSSTMSACPAASTDITDYVTGLHYPVVDPSKITVTATWYQANNTNPQTWSTCGTTVCNARGNQVRVKVSYPFPLDIPFVPSQTLNISSTAEMVISN